MAYITNLLERTMTPIANFQNMENQLTEFDNAFYWNFITIYSVGYGDLYPATYLGRIIVVLTGLGGALLLALIIRMFY